MLFISTSFTLASPNAMSDVALLASPVLNRICNMGMSAANEKMLSTAERMLNTIDCTRYFLYGGMKRRIISRNSFMICLWLGLSGRVRGYVL